MGYQNHRLTDKTREEEYFRAMAIIATIQDLLGHEHVTTTQRYCRVVNLKVQRDYYKAMEAVLRKAQDESMERSHEWRDEFC